MSISVKVQGAEQSGEAKRADRVDVMATQRTPLPRDGVNEARPGVSYDKICVSCKTNAGRYKCSICRLEL